MCDQIKRSCGTTTTESNAPDGWQKKKTDLLFDLLGSLVDLEEGGAIQQSLLMENADIAEHNQLPQVSSEQHAGKRKKQKITINQSKHYNASKR